MCDAWVPSPLPSARRRVIPYPVNDQAYDLKPRFATAFRELLEIETSSRFDRHDFHPVRVAHEGLLVAAAERGWTHEPFGPHEAFRKGSVAAVFSLIQHPASYANRSPVEYVLARVYVHHGALVLHAGRNGDGPPRWACCRATPRVFPIMTETDLGELVFAAFRAHRFSVTHDYAETLAPHVLAALKAFVDVFM